MKSKFALIVVLAALLTSPLFGVFGHAVDAAPECCGKKSTSFAVMVSDALHLRAAIATAEEMQVAQNHYAFEIVIVGELVKPLAEDRSLVEDVDKAEKLGVKLVVCENAVTYFKVPREKLDKRLKFTKNGWIYMFELKDKGFNTLAT